MVAYLDSARAALAVLLSDHLPGARYRVPDATYIGWIHMAALDLPGSPATFFRERAVRAAR